MTWTLYKHGDIKGLYIDRKMVGILSVFVLLGICLVVSLVVATNTLSGLRAYSTMQGYWTEARNDGTSELILYLKTGNSDHLDHFTDVTRLIRDARELKMELDRESPDYQRVEEKLLAIKTNPRDINKMITTFERFHTFDHFSNAVAMWDSAINLINRMEDVADRLREKSVSGNLQEREIAAYLELVRSIDDQFRDHKDVVSASLSEGTHILQLAIIWLSVMMGSIIVLSGFMLSYRFLNRIKVWAKIIEISEQRYKSLFEFNPNAVFSITKDGLISSGNNAFLKLTGYRKEEIDMEHIESLAPSFEKKLIRESLKKVSKGIAQSFESSWKQKSGEIVPVQMTMLPIYVDEKIEGVFLMAEDISFQKYAEERIKKQLEEKTSLLSEVHDRVKNNLALMSGMLQLQDQYINDETARIYLKSTMTRIHSMALVHERLYQTETFANVRMDEIVTELVESTGKTYLSEPDLVNIHIDAEPLTLDIKKGISCGLLLNELVSNTFKYAYNGHKQGNLWVTLQKDQKKLALTVKDDGEGLDDDFELNTQSTLGMTLIRTLVKQLHGEIDFNNNNGLEVRVSFEMNGLVETGN